LSAQGILSILIVPVFLHDGFWGFVGFDDCKNERLFSDNEESILRSSSLLFAHAYHKNTISRQIAEHDKFNRAMFKSAPIGLTVFDDEYNLIDCNDAILRMYGGITKEFYLDNFYKLSPEYQADGVSSKEKVLENLKRVLDGEVLKTEWLHCSLDNEPIPCEVTITRVESMDKYRVLAYTYDLRQIYIDSLTGIFNRRYFDESFTSIVSLLSRSNANLSLLIVDVDYFKLYNDTYGHQSGDEFLKKVAGLLSSALRRTNDFAARYGGEVFAVVLPNTGEEGARLIVNNILESIRKSNILHEQSKIADHVTVSIGVASGRVDSIEDVE
jgi:diguanylate cyclase (GGDEF)-like protein